MSWHATLNLDYRRDDQRDDRRDDQRTSPRTVAHFLHDGPLRILQSLYPEGEGICHNVLVHPPGGLVGGDTLDIRVKVGAGAHGLVTTPGATRFYRSRGEPARQWVQAELAEGARLEWLPLEALAYNDCLAENRAVFTLAPGAELLGWDVTALGLPAADQPFERGYFSQHLEVPGLWLEQGRIDARDHRLMDSPLGLDGQRCLGTLFFVAGTPLERSRRERALEVARALLQGHALQDRAGATSPHPQVLVVRVLAPLVEPAMDLLRPLWAAWRQELWSLEAVRPRIWAM